MGPVVEELRRPQGAYELAGRFWNHAPAMFTTLRSEGVAWPEIEPGEMADLMAYLQADLARDPAPDLFQGQVLLVRKGWKHYTPKACQRLPIRPEGGWTLPR